MIKNIRIANLTILGSTQPVINFIGRATSNE